MKIKIKQFKKDLVIVLWIIAPLHGICQGGLWQAKGTDTVLTNREVKINKSLIVKEKITTGELHVHGTLQVGDSTFYWVPNFGIPAFDQMRSDNNRVAIMGGNSTSFNPNVFVGIGTTNQQSGQSLSAIYDVAARAYQIGQDRVLSLTAGTTVNVGVGAGLNNTVGGSVFLGYMAGSSINGANTSNNTFLGNYSGQFVSGGSNNTYTGTLSGFNSGPNNNNCYYGMRSGENNTGSANVFMGAYSGNINTLGSNNTFIGYYADGSAN